MYLSTHSLRRSAIQSCPGLRRHRRNRSEQWRRACSSGVRLRQTWDGPRSEGWGHRFAADLAALASPATRYGLVCKPHIHTRSRVLAVATLTRTAPSMWSCCVYTAHHHQTRSTFTDSHSRIIMLTISINRQSCIVLLYYSWHY